MIFDGRKRQGRPKHEPARQTVPYARLQNIFSSWGGGRDRPIIKATPSNLRRFSRTVYARRALRIIKDSIATKAFVVRPKDGVEVNPELQRQIDLVTSCFARPNNDDSWRSLVEQLVEDICVAGAGALEQQVGGDKMRPLWLWPVDALTIQIVPGWDGEAAKARYWQTLGYGNVGTQQGRALRNDELVYMRSDPSTDTPFGLGWLEVAFNTINRQLATAEFAGNVAGNATPANLLFFKGASAEDIQTVRNYWTDEIEGQGKFPIFGSEDMKSVQLHATDDKSLLIKYYELLVREIAAASGLSPMNFAIERDVNRGTAEVGEDRDYRQTIIPIASLVTSYLNREVIEGRLGFSQIEVAILGLDREDELATSKVLQNRWSTNSITADEIRSRYGEAPMESVWGKMTKADVDIAIAAARGAKQVDDPDLKSDPVPVSPAKKGNRK